MLYAFIEWYTPYLITLCFGLGTLGLILILARAISAAIEH